MPERALRVPPEFDDKRADSAIAAITNLPRAIVQSAIAAGDATQDGHPIAKPAEKLRSGAWLSVRWTTPEPLKVVASPVDDLRIVWEDDHLIVVDKPPGVAAHPSLGWDGPTVAGGLAAMGRRLATSGAPERQGIVHRLDAGTSGLMVVASSEDSYREMKRKFHDREVAKIYHCLVQGHPDPLAGTIDAPVGRHPAAGWRFAVVSDGKHAITHYETLEAFPAASLLRIELETGRTHQIRVHMAAQRHPSVGDSLYGADPVLSARLQLKRQWLHATELGFTHPISGEQLHFTSAYSSDLAGALETLRDG